MSASPLSTQSVITGGTTVKLAGSLPGEHASKGEAVSIPVIADDGKHRKDILLTKKIGAGGEGSVFETNLGNGSAFVAKIYAREKLTDTKCNKLQLMLSKSIQLKGVCFPVALIKNEANETVGFLMPRAKGYELGKSVFMPKVLQKKFPTWTRRETIQLCLTILEKIAYLNEHGIILGDINGQNILVESPDEVFLVDCDSYQIGNYPCPAGTDHFTAPEAQGRGYSTFLRTQAMENFAIATLLFMIMLPGKSPYSAVGGASPSENIRNGLFAYESSDNGKVPPGKWGYIWSHMSFKTREAFVETFRKDGSHFNPSDRLSAHEWIDVFEAYQHGLSHMLKRDPMAADLFPTRMKMRECKKCHEMFIPDPKRYSPVCPKCDTRKYHPASKENSNSHRSTHEKLLIENPMIEKLCSTPGCNNVIRVPYRSRNREMFCVSCQKKQQAQRATERAKRRAEERSRSQAQQAWLKTVWKQYPCKNPKCNNTITLYNRDQARYRYRQPEYCNDCLKDTPCKKCGYVAAKWMHDERGGLCRRCYEEEQRAKNATSWSRATTGACRASSAATKQTSNTSRASGQTASKAPSNTSAASTNTTKPSTGIENGCLEGCLGYVILFVILGIIASLLNSCS